MGFKGGDGCLMGDLVMIVAMTPDRVIGNGSDIPWRKTKEDRKKYSEDMKRFASLTTPHPVIMGRKTWDTIPEKFRPLPERANIIVTRNPDFKADGAIVRHSIGGALKEAFDLDNVVYSAGGAEVYKQMMDFATRLEVTEIHREFEGDQFFPEISEQYWKILSREDKEDYSFVSYAKRM
jgi:dihydrofolate reductase